MTLRQLVFERNFDLPRAIVWDALVDPILVGGWLGEACIDPVEGGVYRLEWLGSTGTPAANGVISTLSGPERLVVTTDVHGEFDVVLDETDGGSRGTSTRLQLHVRVEIEDAFEARAMARWARSLDQLGELLRGHPVDWFDASRRVPSAGAASGTDRA